MRIIIIFILTIVFNEQIFGQYKRIDEIKSLSHLKIDLFNPKRGLRYNKVFNKQNFSAGERVKIGSSMRAYEGNNIPIVGDFNADGFDDIGVKWVNDQYKGEWVVSLNNKNGSFSAGTRVKVGSSYSAYKGNNIPIIGDFNADGYDDIGVKWLGNQYKGEWVVSLNNKNGSFSAGERVKIGSSMRAYEGNNIPIVGDFNADGFDDIGVKWVDDQYNGEWVISLNNKNGSFSAGTRVKVGSSYSSYKGNNIPIVGDFNADGYDDIGVKWIDDQYNGEWVISLNDKKGGFLSGQRVTTGTSTNAFTGINIPIVGDFNGDEYDDVGVKWIGNTYNGEWVISENVKEEFSRTKNQTIFRLGFIVINFKDEIPITKNEIETTIDLLKKHFELNFYGRLSIDLKYKIIDLDNRVDWTGGVKQPIYNLINGNLENPLEYPVEDNFRGYNCRFNFPESDKKQIIFKNYKGALGWIPSENPNVFRNYCQIAERNFAKNPLYKWYRTNTKEFNEFMNWTKSHESDGPYLGFIGRGLPGGGDRYFEKTVGKRFPLKVGDFLMKEYLYGHYSLAFINHEIGHFLGHKRELYGNNGDACDQFDENGSLQFYDVMALGNGFPAYSAFTRWRFGLFSARYISNTTKKTIIKLPPSLKANNVKDSFIVIQPDPKYHPNEFFILENRTKTSVKVNGRNYIMNDLGEEGLMIYHINSKDNSRSKPLISLEKDPIFCPNLVPFQGVFDSSSNPSSQFYDGTDSKLSIKKMYTDDIDNIFLEISFK